MVGHALFLDRARMSRTLTTKHIPVRVVPEVDRKLVRGTVKKFGYELLLRARLNICSSDEVNDS